MCRRHTLHRGPLRWVLCGRDRSSLQRTHCTPKAPNAHVCEPSGIFSAVHAAGENDWNFFASADANSARLRDVTKFFGRPAAEARPRVRAETRPYDVTNAAGREKARVHCTRAFSCPAVPETSQSLAEFASADAKKFQSFSPAACTAEKIPLGSQTCALGAFGVQCVRCSEL